MVCVCVCVHTLLTGGAVTQSPELKKRRNVGDSLYNYFMSHNS